MAQRGAAATSQSAQGFYFTASLLLVILLASSTQLLPARLVPGWLRTERASTRVMWPQGWGFFADQPTADANAAFSVGDDGQLTAVTQLQMTRSTDWGLSRSAYARHVELGILSSQVASGDWLDCTELTPVACKSMALHTPMVRSLNHTSHPSFCGHLLISVESPVRWTTNTPLWQSEWKILRIVNAGIECAG
ncbi:SdpA family antimicrobial peptide system protein [Kitasatospora sp. NPDC058965]|uniref:SdpA family antimicrobial peptide system protein n=1 Tax=Kitasatospora sp. NPDC058965 TaxID=3346682 RepID=UPI0036C41D35